ncbi:MAG: aminotransferase class V-fold PLP-dependent enzyme, partial [Pseudomonadales bacterium]
MRELVYLDFNATTPLADQVVEAMEPYLREAYGNPSSLHWSGVPARDAIETARSQVASLLCCDATEIVFTSGGSESNNQALKVIYFTKRSATPVPHFIFSQIEHPTIREPCR